MSLLLSISRNIRLYDLSSSCQLLTNVLFLYFTSFGTAKRIRGAFRAASNATMAFNYPETRRDGTVKDVFNGTEV